MHCRGKKIRRFLRGVAQELVGPVKHFAVLISDYIRGTYGVVVKGVRKDSERTEVAIKFIAKKDLQEEKIQSVIYPDKVLTISGINKEVEIMSTCKHGHVLKLLDFFETEEQFAVVTELCFGIVLLDYSYVPGGDLFDYLYKKVYLPEDLCSRIIYEIAQGVDYLHRHHIVHRDLKVWMLSNKSNISSWRT